MRRHIAFLFHLEEAHSSRSSVYLMDNTESVAVVRRPLRSWRYRSGPL